MAEAEKKRKSTVGAGATGAAQLVAVPRRKFGKDLDQAETAQETSAEASQPEPKNQAETEQGSSKQDNQPVPTETKSVNTSKRVTKPQKGEGEKKTRVSFHLSETLAERVRNTVDALSGPPHRLSMAKIAEDALQDACKKYEQDNNGGKLFPQRPGHLVGGRRVS